MVVCDRSSPVIVSHTPKAGYNHSAKQCVLVVGASVQRILSQSKKGPLDPS